MSECNLSFSSHQSPVLRALADSQPMQDGSHCSCPAGTGHLQNGTLREFVRIIAQIVIDDLLAGQGDEAIQSALQQSTTGPLGPEKEDV